MARVSGDVVPLGMKDAKIRWYSLGVFSLITITDAFIFMVINYSGHKKILKI